MLSQLDWTRTATYAKLRKSTEDVQSHAMDFWARLIGGVGSSPRSKQLTSQNPQQRLTKFKKVYNQLLTTWRSSVITDPAAIEALRHCIHILTSILHEEARTPAPHTCLAFAAEFRIYSNISKIATKSHNEAIIREAISAFNTLIDTEEEEDFLSDGEFAKSLVAFVGNISGANAMVVGGETEGEVVELLFAIAAKIRLQPEILPVWFTSRNFGESEMQTDETSKFTGATHKEDFPLFYLLIDYVHHEGRVGDFARTGLLYIIESASHSEELERWIVESDLATLMATGLGALYSQLSRKLVITYPLDDLPSVLSLSDYAEVQQAVEAESSTSPEFKGHMETFLSYLVFWQDVLEHCKSYEVKQTLLDHFQVLFLQQLLYPSLLESSDVDGGSSVAVLTYLQRILDSIDHAELIHLILHYLLALPGGYLNKAAASPRSPNAARKRKSLELLSKYAEEENPTPALFNLVDLVLTSLNSRSQQTITAALKLVSVILRRHHRFAIATLLQTSPVSSAAQRSIGAHNKEMAVFFSLAEEIGGKDTDFNESYSNHLKDNLILIEHHPCSASLLNTAPTRSGSRKVSTIGSMLGASNTREPYPHFLRTGDPLLKGLNSLLETFLTNTVELNLSLTETIIDLASCGYMRLEGWLLVDPANYEYDDEGAVDDNSSSAEEHIIATSEQELGQSETEEKARLRAFKAALREPSWVPSSTPALLTVLHSLLTQVRTCRSEISNFDTHLAVRRQAFQVSDELSEALSTTSLSHHRSQGSSTPTQSPKIPALDSISQRMFSNPTSISRSTSPRGRSQQIGTPTPAPKLKPGAISLGSPSPSRRAFSPSPLREGALPPSARDVTSAPIQPPSFALGDALALKNKPAAVRDILRPFYDKLRREEGGDVSSSASSIRSGSVGPADSERGVDEREAVGGKASERERWRDRDVTVSHLLTNVIILQEFILELAALVQVRASVFGDVRFV